MLFSLGWLRSICPVPADAERVAGALTDRGLTVDSLDRSRDDPVLDVDVPANRPDCLGHLGVARELSAAFGVDLVDSPPGPDGTGPPVADQVTVEIEDPLLCARYTARLVRQVRVAPSPQWVVERLAGCGLRSVNNVVDASNLVLLELGHPIHFFDLQRLEADASSPPRTLVRIRRALAGERLTTLDGIERQLTPDALVIADGRRAVALAGVIGGADSEITDATRNVLIEAAHFDPRSIRRTARGLGVQTDASYRFERGVDPEGLLAAQSLAVRLLGELAGGEPAPGVVDAYPARAATRRLTLRPDQLRRLLGFQPDRESVVGALDALRLDPHVGEDGRIGVSVPSWRLDLEREVDLVEEVARHIGYDRIPVARSPTANRTGTSPDIAAEEKARDILAHLGFHEAVGYAMIGHGHDSRFVPADCPPPLPLTNPIAEHLGVLRRSLLPGLLQALDLNLRRGNRDVRLFEVGRVFRGAAEAGFPLEPSWLGLGWSGSARPLHWSEPARMVDLYDVIGLVQRVLAGLVPGYTGQPGRTDLPAYHPGRSASWAAPSGAAAAWAGALHPDLQQDLDAPAFVAEVDLEAFCPPAEPEARQQAPLPRLPAVTRDLSLVVREGIPYSAVLAALRSVTAPAAVTLDAVDRYVGPPLKAGESSLTIRLTLQPWERTLTDSETEQYRGALVAALERELDIRIRS